MQVKCGSYTGNASSARSITGVGFQPDLVIVKNLPNSYQGYFKTSAMPSTVSFEVRGDSSAFTGNRISALGSDGFTVESDAAVNGSGETHMYLAVKIDGTNDFAVGMYTGDGADGLSVSVGFDPNYFLSKSNSNIVGATKYSTQSGSNASMHFGGDDRSDLITMVSGGVTINNGSASTANLVNVSGVSHYWFAFKEVNDFSEVFQYTGNGSDNRDITTPGFQSDFILMKSQFGGLPQFRNSGAHSGDNSQAWDTAQAANGIQSISSTGFQVGTATSVNENSAVYNVLVLKQGTSGGASSPFGRIFGSLIGRQAVKRASVY